MEDKIQKYNKCIEKIYKRKKIIIGLTGKTGSGCTTTSEILKSKSFSDLNIQNITQYPISEAEKCKLETAINFLKQKNNWEPFKVLKVSNIIIDFLIRNGAGKFKNYITTITNSNKSIKRSDNGKLINKVSSLLKDGKKILPQSDSEKEITQYYFKKLNEFCNTFKNELIQFPITVRLNGENKKLNFYYYFMQQIGNNIRASGDPYSEIFNGENYSKLSEKIIDIIEKCDENDRICIDALRNPFESMYLKEHCPNFYLISINTDEKTRRSRLGKLLPEDSASGLDYIEYPRFKQSVEETFYHQNIQKCLEITDIHLDNSEESQEKFSLTANLIRYIALILHPGLITPTKFERCMQVAFTARVNSGCLSRKVGAVVTDSDFSIKSIGWNDIPKGQTPCNLRFMDEYFHHNCTKFSNFELTNPKFQKQINNFKDHIDNKELRGLPICYCFKDVFNSIDKKNNQVHTRAVHAEENAFLNISKHGGVGLKGGNLFVTASPCELCSKKSYQLGIKNIYYIDPYPGISKDNIIESGDQEFRPQMHLFNGAVGQMYFNLYLPKICYKDEFELMTGIDQKKITPLDEYELIYEKNLLVIKNNENVVLERTLKGKVLSNDLAFIKKGVVIPELNYENNEVIPLPGSDEIRFEIEKNAQNNLEIKVYFKESKQKGDEFYFSFKTTFKKESIENYYMYRPNYAVKNLVLSMKDETRKIKNVKAALYTDEKKQEKLLEMKVNCVDDIFSVEFTKPSRENYFCLEWSNSIEKQNQN